MKRTRAIASLLDSNTTITKIVLDEHEDERDENVWNNEVMPRIQTNIHMERAATISHETDVLKLKLLGGALAKVSTNPVLAWLFVSEHKELLAESIEAGTEHLRERKRPRMG